MKRGESSECSIILIEKYGVRAYLLRESTPHRLEEHSPLPQKLVLRILRPRNIFDKFIG